MTGIAAGGLSARHVVVWVVAVTACARPAEPPPPKTKPAPPGARDAAMVPNAIPVGLAKLVRAYPEHLARAEGNTVIWADGTRMRYDDAVPHKSFLQRLAAPDLQDQMAIPYPRGRPSAPPARNEDPGRIRFEPFFRKMYGDSREAVNRRLVWIPWLPKTVGGSVLVTTINDVHTRLTAVSDELDALPDLKAYLDNPAGTFNWRTIRGTDRLSMHSFGIAIDINIDSANYWRWDARRGNDVPKYTNRVPLEIVEIFEKHGFIWGGKWYHYDTMHFEYRPELLIE